MPPRYKSNPYRPFTSFVPQTNPRSDSGTRFDSVSGMRFDPLNENIDLVWGGTRQVDDRTFNNYYDYFFSGEDIKVYIDGLFDQQDEMDIASLGYLVKQEKQPLYGFWSYNYDAMMLGTRLVTGEFSVYTRYPRRMTELLEKAAEARLNSSSQSPSANVMSILGADTARVEDEENIQKFWAYSQLDRITQDPYMNKLTNGGDHNIFSAHPPFNLVIFHGLEEVGVSSVSTNPNPSTDQINRQLNSDRIMATDTNERRVLFEHSGPMKIVLQNVHLLSMSTAYASGGQPLVENYQFIARDFYYTEGTVRDNAIAKRRSSVASQASATQSNTSTTTNSN